MYVKNYSEVCIKQNLIIMSEKKTSVIIKPTREAYEEWERLNKYAIFDIDSSDEEPSYYRKPTWILDHRNRTAIDLRNLSL